MGDDFIFIKKPAIMLYNFSPICDDVT